MLRHLILGAMAFVASSATVVWAGPKDDLAAAAQKLADSPNYTFNTTTANAGGGGGRGFGGGGPTTGKTEKDGFTTFSVTMQQNSYDVVIKGDKAAIKTDNGWELASDLTKPDANGGGFNPAMFVAFRAQTFKAPAAQASDIISKLGDVTSADDALSADLSADTVKEMAAFRPRPAAGGDQGQAPQMDVTNPSGSAKFWIKDGVLTKMELHLKYTVSFNGNDRDVDRTTTTEITDVGATKVDVPDEAKSKLGS